MRLLRARVIDRPVTKPCRSAQRIFKIILFEQFQIALPPGKFGIILRADLASTRWVPANTQK